MTWWRRRVDGTRTGSPLLTDAAAAFALAWRSGRVRTGAYVATAVAQSVIPVSLAALLRWVVDDLAQGRVADLAGPLTGIVVAGVAAAVLPHAEAYLSAQLSRESALLADDRLYSAVNRFPGLSRFEDPVFLDRLRCGQQAGGLAPGQVVQGVTGTLRDAATIAGFVALLVGTEPGVAVAVVLGGVPLVVAELRLSRRRAAMMWSISSAQRREFFYGMLLTSVEAAKETRLFGAGRFLRGRMRDERLSTNAAQRRMDVRELRTQSGLGVAAAAVSGGTLVWAVLSARAGRVSVGDIAIFIAAVTGVQSTLTTVVRQAALTHQQLLLFAHYRHVVTVGSDLPVAVRPRPVPALTAGIEFRDVWFRHSDHHPWILRGVDLVIPAGAATAIVGVNGAGKSTLVKLLCRFYDPVRGAVLWDGVDLRDVAPEALRRRIGAVFQDFMSYDLTAADNIGIGDLELDGDPSAIRAAARQADVDDVITALPAGYRTPLTRLFADESTDGAAGVVLSGGQWQRLALARGLLRRSDVLILDEPSSGLDPDAEEQIHRRLRQHRTGRTSLLISHRLGTLRDADQIVVLSHGRVAERGTHAELMATGGLYAGLFETQARGYRPVDDVRGAAAAESVRRSA